MNPSPSGALEGLQKRGPEGKLHVVLLTYNRMEALEKTLREVSSQTRPPDTILVVDNGSLPEAELVAIAGGGDYLDAGNNLGPAGGFSLGMARILETAGPDDWIVTLGDDGPPRTPDRFEKLWDFGIRCADFHPRLAAVGSNGALYDRESGRFVRVPDSQLNGPVPVDYLAGSQFHRCEALRALGPYREELFFGFEEAEYGLRARRAGWALFADGEMWFEDRVKAGRLNLKKGSSIPNTAAWRRFYSARNITALAREYGSRPTAALRVAVRTAVSGAIALLRTGRPMRDVMAPLRGSLDGYRGKLGRTINPAKANKVN